MMGLENANFSMRGGGSKMTFLVWVIDFFSIWGKTYWHGGLKDTVEVVNILSYFV